MVWQKLTQQIKTFNEKSPGFLESEKKSRENYQGISIRTVTSIRILEYPQIIHDLYS